MRQLLLLSVLLTMFAPLTNAGDTTALSLANRLYASGSYDEAADHYEKLLLSEGVAPELYYNLGNAYFKANELGKAILNYERAVRLKPGYADALHNLEFANLKVVDNIDSNDAFFLKKWFNMLVKSRTSNGWFWLGGISFTLTMVFMLLFVFGKTMVMRKVFFYLGMTGLLISFVSVFFSAMRKQQLLSHNEAIVLSGIVVVKSAPDKSGTDLYQLHEGSKVSVISILGDWYEVRPGSGNVGWVEVKHLEKI
jgi:hypothetical protein